MIEHVELVVLANSFKEGGRCLAGKTVITGRWIRPISDRTKKGELNNEEYSDPQGVEYKQLDILRIPLKISCPEFYQPENYLFDHRRIKRIGQYPFEQLENIVDRPNSVWLQDSRQADRLCENTLQDAPPNQSLLLIKPERFSIRKIGSPPKFRAVFVYNEFEYDLSITDPSIYHQLKYKKGDLIVNVRKPVFLCISLGQIWNGYSFKLVSSIIADGDLLTSELELHQNKDIMRSKAHHPYYVLESDLNKYDPEYYGSESDYQAEVYDEINSELRSDEMYNYYFGDDEFEY
ncbi:MAG: hypothetical protein GX963_11775 [Bacteroidales bacterium]|nr:hypothetical protein [Bacteroidales bacterium]